MRLQFQGPRKSDWKTLFETNSTRVVVHEKHQPIVIEFPGCSDKGDVITYRVALTPAELYHLSKYVPDVVG